MTAISDADEGHGYDGDIAMILQQCRDPAWCGPACSLCPVCAQGGPLAGLRERGFQRPPYPGPVPSPRGQGGA
jgi:hypothetical protein